MYRVVFDTNLIISAHLKSHGIPRMIFKAVLRKYVELYVTKPILDEYERVLNYPKFKFSAEDIQAILIAIKKHSKTIKPKKVQDDGIKDLTDKKFLECALAAKADFIVTGDKKAFEFKSCGNVRLVNARKFLGELGLRFWLEQHN